MQNEHNLIWIDLEMTGLDPSTDVILEIATIITDSNLNTLAEGPVVAIYQKEKNLQSMDLWNQTTHKESRLLERVRCSKFSSLDAELVTLDFIKEWVPRGKSPMCGNSVCQDRRFLSSYMKDLVSFFHYRNLDVSTLKELAARWKPEVARNLVKKHTHSALYDIRESIIELQYYRKHFIK